MYKKRHNPPIYEEEMTVKAFDRNNDATIKTESLEQKTEQQEAKPKVQKTRGPLISKSMNEKGLIISLLLGIGFCTNEVMIKQIRYDLERSNAREQAILMYADTNNDGTITPQEERDLDSRILKENNAVTREGYRIYLKDNGQEVSDKTIAKWYKNYRPNQ